jgi:hypothetical protein
LYHIGKNWRKGETIDLEKSLVLDVLGANNRGLGASFPPTPLDVALQVMGWRKSQSGPFGSHHMSGESVEPDPNVDSKDPRLPMVRWEWPRDDYLYVLFDARIPDILQSPERREVVRGEGRLTDCTKQLHAAGALIVAHAGDVSSKRFVPAPVPLTINDKKVEGKGEILFSWALPVEGTPLSTPDALKVSMTPAGAFIPAAGATPAATQRESLLNLENK